MSGLSVLGLSILGLSILGLSILGLSILGAGALAGSDAGSGGAPPLSGRPKKVGAVGSIVTIRLKFVRV